MKKPIIFSVIVTLLSFGVIDSAALKNTEKESNEIDLVDILKEQELEKQCLIDSIKLQEIYYTEELNNFLTDIGFR